MSTAILPAATSLEGQLASLVRKVLRDPLMTVPPDASLASLGIDSLACAELLVAIEDTLGVTIDPMVMYEHHSVGALAGWLARDRSVATADPATAALAAMRHDAVLPDDVRPRGAPVRTGVALVTGATGFVGAHLVARLLRQEDRRVTCLARGPQARERVVEAMRRYGSWDDQFEDRIAVIAADLAQPCLGLSTGAWQQLADEVDVIHHAAAAVDWVQPYAALRDTNVLGTLELLRLACTGAPKPFHFLSSLAVCYSTTALQASETTDPMLHLEGLQLGYAQSKAVAEALVREAARRGLPARIVRPALVSGESSGGVSNVDDLVGLLLRGCVSLQAAPDLDWTLDVVPVDHLVDVVATLPPPAAGDDDVVHVANASPRSWRECVLWMCLRGHPMRLLPYRQWAALVREQAVDATHPLAPLRGFLLRTVRGDADRFLPELFEDPARTAVDMSASLCRTGGAGGCPPLDPALLERYFAYYDAAGVLATPPGRGSRVARAGTADPGDDDEHPVTDRTGGTAGRTPRTRLATDDSIVAELTSWHSGRATGLFLAVDDRTGQEVVIKEKCADAQVIEVATALASLCSPSLGAAWRRYRHASAFVRGHVRELALHRCDDPRWIAHTPRTVECSADEARGTWRLVMERVIDIVPTGGVRGPWQQAHVAAALDGLAVLHAIWHGRTAALDPAILAPRRDAIAMRMLEPLWMELARHARPLVSAVGGARMAERHAALAESTCAWWQDPAPEQLTLVHNDFNPRNILLRGDPAVPRLCALDWELATVGRPQRDVMELLCFVLDPSDAGSVHRWLEHARQGLDRETGRAPDAVTWRAGAVVALGELLVDRLATYAMLHRVRPQHFLPRVLATWNALHQQLTH